MDSNASVQVTDNFDIVGENERDAVSKSTEDIFDVQSKEHGAKNAVLDYIADR